MNKCIFHGRCTRDVDLNASGKVASVNLAVDRYFNGETKTDFVSLKFLGENLATRAAKFLKKGSEIVVDTEYQQGEYTNKEGVKVRTHDFVVQRWDFCGSRADNNQTPKTSSNNDFMSIPDGMSELPFN